MSAVRTLSTLNKNNTALQDSLSKVSSGLKINTAKDDASGYAISERMRVQIRSLDQATQNSQNASSLMKNAEGAVERTVEILRTLKQKAIDAATDTNTDDDRATIQKEIDQFIDQIDDNALVTFNGKYLLEGSRAQSGDAVATHMTNSNLSTDTNLNTQLINLENRNGENLEINTGDRVTVSFVMGGKTYTSVLTSVKTTTRLGDIFSGTTFGTVTAGGKQFQYTMLSKFESEKPIGADADQDEVTFKLHGLLFKDISDPNSATASYSTYTFDTAGKLTAALGDFNLEITAQTTTAVGTVSYSSTGVREILNTNNFDSLFTLSGSALMTSYVAGTTVLEDTTIGTTASGKIEQTKDGMNALTFMAKNGGLEGQISGLSISVADSEGNVKKATNTALDAFKTTIYAANETADGSVSFQVGASANQAIKVGLMDMRSEALGLKGRDGTTIQVTTRTAANAAVAAFDNAINKALDQQTTIGAISARLDYTASNLTTSSENVQAAERSTPRTTSCCKRLNQCSHKPTRTPAQYCHCSSKAA